MSSFYFWHWRICVLMRLNKGAFSGCSSLTNTTIGDSVTSIGYKAFYNCSGLTSITIGNSVTSIGAWAFRDCSGLTSITIGNGVTSIGDVAFYNCSGLTSVTIPDSVTSIGERAFYFCENITIYAKAKTKPNGWEEDWNIIIIRLNGDEVYTKYATVVWGYKG